MSVPDTVRHGAREVIFESYPEVGFNYRMTDMQAAVGRVQLTRLASIVEERRRIAQRVRTHDSLTATGVMPPVEPAWARTNWQSYWSSCRPTCDQRDVMQRMLDDGISTRRRRHERASRTPLPLRTEDRDAAGRVSRHNGAGSYCRSSPACRQQMVQAVCEPPSPSHVRADDIGPARQTRRKDIP